MRISTKWLAEYVDLPAAEELAQRLTAVGLEVEAIERLGAGLSGIVVARIVASEKHPNAEKLSVTRVDAGAAEHLQVVCGAKNYAIGDLVPLAMVGAVLPGGQKIEKAKLRGVESFGMLCSARELGFSQDASGLLILPPDLAPGTPIANALGQDDVVLEVNVTPNRPDALSHVGIAREVGAILGTPIRLAFPALAEHGAPASEAVRVRIEAPAKCAHYAARVVEGVTIGPSPRWLVERLEACGVRSISNVVDVTNFVLLELGHPLHAFDLDRVAGREIVVRTAHAGEKLTTLDGKQRALEEDDLVIADRDRASALAGVMGGGDSEISAGTTRVLVESAWFDPATIRRTAKRHQLRTEASFRFERGADQGAVRAALDRCAALIAELSRGTVRPGVVEACPRPFRAREVRLRWARPGELLGAPVSRETASRILGALGFRELDADGEGARLEVPSWRVDVSREEDLVEEIVRTEGYDAIPETLPLPVLGTPAAPREAALIDRVRSALEAAGFCEAVNFSFVSPRDVASLEPAARPIALANAITAELAVMRTSLVPSLLRNASHNRRQGRDDIRLFELAKVYAVREGSDRDPPADERTRLAAVLCGRRAPLGWTGPAPVVDFFDAKAVVQGVLDSLAVRGATFEPAPPTSWLHPRISAAVRVPGQLVGLVGELHPRVAQAFDLPRGVLAFELDAAALLSTATLVPLVSEVPRFPAVLRDLAVVVASEVSAASVLEGVRAEPLVEDATLFDVYTGAPVPDGHKNLALAIRYRAADRTLTDQEADAAHARIVERLRTDSTVRAELRA